MTQVLMGKVLPNLKITLDDSNAEENIEEGEITDDESEVEHFISSEKEKPQSIEIVRTWMKTLPNPKVYENKNGAFITGIDLSSEVVVKKLEERAARFGLERNEERQITQDEINALYSSMDIDIENRNSNKIMNIRLNAIHMRGVNEMNTSEIFQYFSDYGASTVEWINDYSCNVVWVDDTSAARALLGMSRVLSIKRKKDENDMKFDLKNDEKDSKDSKENEAIILMSESEESDSEESVDSRSKSEKDDLPMDIDQKEDVVTRDSPSVDVPIPPGTWRLGMPHPKAKAILLRFATKDDRKLPGAEKRSQFYQKYGNPNYGGLRGLISTSRKRKIQAAKNREVIGKFSQETNYQDEIHAFVQDRPAAPRSGRLKQPRMKMYADEEEEKKIKRKKQVAEYSSDGKKNIFSRLGTKYTKEDLYHLGRKFSDNEENESDKKEERKVTSRFSIWNDIAKSMADEENYSPRDEVKSKEPTRDLRNNLDGSASRKRTHSPPRYHDKFSSRISSHSSFSDRRVKSSFSDRKMKSAFSDRRTNSSSDRRIVSSSNRRRDSSSDRRRDSSSDRRMNSSSNKRMDSSSDRRTYSSKFQAFVQDRPAAPRSGRLKQPRMKMYADEEEEKKIKRKKQVAEYSSDGKKNIFSRLGTKYTKEDLYHLGRKFSDNEENESDKKEERKVTSRFSIWNDIAKSMADEENYSPRDEVKSKEPTRDLRNNLDGSASRKRTHSPPRYHDKFSSRISSHSSFSDRRVKSSFSDRKMKSAFSDRRTNSSSDRRIVSSSNRRRDSSSDRRRDSSSDRRMNSSSNKRMDSSSDRRTYSSKFQGDLRSKIKKLKRDDSESASKHRSPLCKDD